MSTNDFQPATLRASLRSFVLEALSLADQVEALSAKLQPYGTDIRFLGGVCVADDAFTQWIKDLEKRVTEQYSGETTAEASLIYGNNGRYPCNGIPEDKDLRWEWCRAGNLAEYEPLLDKTLESIDFDVLSAEIKRQAGSMVGEGYKKAANLFAAFLGLTGYTPDPTLFKGNSLTFSWYFNNSITDRMDRTKGLGKLIDCASVVEQDAGITGLQQALDQIRRVIWEASSLEPLQNRTRMGNPAVLEGVTYKQKIKFSMAKDTADALLAFIAQFGDVDLTSTKLAA